MSLAKTDCKGGKSVGRNDRLWHQKNPDLSKASSQSHRIPLWHLKSPDLSKASSQSHRIPLWHLKSPDLSKAVSQSPRIPLSLNPVIRMPISNKEGTAYGGPGALWHLKSRYLPKAPSQIRTQPPSSKAKTGILSREFGASRIPEFWHRAFAQERAVPVPKRLSLIFACF